MKKGWSIYTLLAVAGFLLVVGLSGCLTANAPVGRSDYSSTQSFKSTGSVVCGEPQVYTLWGGKTIRVGTVTVSNDGEKLYVTYRTTGDWYLKEVQLYVLNYEPKERLAPGLAPYKSGDISYATTYTFIVPLSDLSYEVTCDETTLWLQAHAAVVKVVDGTVVQGETAYGGVINPNPPQGSWYGNIEYTVQCCEEVQPAKPPLSVWKWYDRNMNGTWDEDEPPIEGWPIMLKDSDGNIVASDCTDRNGEAIFDLEELNVAAGVYRLEEGSVGSSWRQTYPASGSYEFELYYDEAQKVWKIIPELKFEFGNVCEIVATGGYTLGFWSNKNGQASLCNGWMNYLSGYNLVGKDGNPFDPKSYSGFRTWLLSADATNMSYMLSVQMAATLLNMECKGANYDGLGVVVGGKWISIGDLIKEVNDFLSKYPNTLSGGPNRAQAEFYKNLFDDLNNNRRKLIPYEPCPVSGCSVE